jgi:hypothetical protein
MFGVRDPLSSVLITFFKKTFSCTLHYKLRSSFLNILNNENQIFNNLSESKKLSYILNPSTPSQVNKLGSFLKKVIRIEDRGSRTPNIFTWKCRFYVLFVTGLLYNCYKLYCLMTIKFWIWIWICYWFSLFKMFKKEDLNSEFIVQCTRKCFSSSIHLQCEHKRCSLGIFECLPFSINRLCSLILSFVISFLYSKLDIDK